MEKEDQERKGNQRYKLMITPGGEKINPHAKPQRTQRGIRGDREEIDGIIIEIKSIEELSKARKKKMLTYLCPGDKKLGLLIDFGVSLI